jgi:UDP-N-acetylglucosamine 1-carboxyvinyltransferase
VFGLSAGDSRVSLTAAELTNAEPPYELVNSLRASFFSIGSLLGRMGHAKVPLPGGCRIGARPVVEHIRGLKALGAVVTVQHGIVTASRKEPTDDSRALPSFWIAPAWAPQKQF